MKNIKFILVVLVLFSFAFLFGCDKENNQEENDDYNLKMLKTYLVETLHASDTLELKVAEDVNLPTQGDHEGTKITWLSKNSEYINSEGKILKYPDTQTDVKMACALEYKGEVIDLEFNFKLATMSLSAAIAKFSEDIPEYIVADLTLINNVDGVIDIAWTSSNEEVLSNQGKYNKPNADTEISITCIASDTNNHKEEVLMTKASGKTDSELFEECKLWIINDVMEELYLDKDINLPKKFKNQVDLKWTSTDENILENDGTVHQTIYDRYVHLKCHVAIGDYTYDFRFNVKVLAKSLEGMSEKDIVKEFVSTFALETVSKREFPLYTNINQNFGFIAFYTKTDPTMTEQIAPVSDENRPGTLKPSIEYITVHDTANNSKGANAAAHANYVSQGGGGTSWSYTVDEKGIYHQIPDNEVSYHAGDGTRFFALLDTDIKATSRMPQVYLKDGNFYIHGQDTHYRPYDDKEATTFVETNYTFDDLGELGIMIEVGENGNYYIGRTYFNTTYNYISNYGGNRNSIGIETCVNQGSDYGHTFRNVAKLCANLCIENNLSVDRVKGHHFFSGKPCPNAILTAEYWAEFKTLVSMEKFAKENLSDMVFSYRTISSNIDSNGYISLDVKAGDEIEYKITVKKGSENLLVATYKTIVE